MNLSFDSLMPRLLAVILVGLFDLLFLIPTPSTAKCANRGSNSCCKGKNVACVAFDKEPRSGRWKRCFCDEFCIRTKDCCSDYQQHCKAIPIDCVVSRWSGWDECSKKCGMGQTSRYRTVLVKPQYSGKQCPALKQMRTCVAYSCPVKKSIGGVSITYRKLKEVGNIIPERFSKWRDNKLYSIKLDIRKNIYWKFNHMDHVHKPTHFAFYDINIATPHCQLGFGATWSKRLMIGRKICVTCHNTVMDKNDGERCQGVGVYLEKTRWKAVGIPHCHGTWTMTSPPKRGDCSGVPPERSFTLV